MGAARHRRRLLIRKGWDSYSAMLPAHAPAAQVRETRRAFYGGALALLDALLDGPRKSPFGDFAVPAGEDTVVVDEAMTGDLQAEINAFADDLEAGKA